MMAAGGNMVSELPGICIIPTLKKGQLVRVRQGVIGIRATTSGERNAWYEKFHADCRAGLDVWHDSAGESRLAPSTAETSFSVGKILTVVSAAASPNRIGLHMPGRGRYCMVIDTSTGQEWLVSKRFLEVV